MQNGKLQLLLIEDNRGDAELVQEYLLESQVNMFVIKHCVRISESLTYLNSGEKIDIILSDVGLPDTTGIETFHKLRNAASDIPLVFMTGTIPDEEAAILALKQGAQDYLVKGQFTPDLLLRSIRYAIERKKTDMEKVELIKKEQDARKQLEIEKNKLELEINERRKLEKQKDEFIGIASHELKTPVTSIKAYTQVLQFRFRKEENSKATQLLSKMDAQIDKLANLVSDLLDVTKVQGGKLQFHKSYFDSNELIEEIVEEMQRTTEKHLIIKDLAHSKSLWGDRDRIGQVIINFLTNAIKYSPHSEKIIVKTSIDSKNIIISVQDFGVGIPKEAQKKVFNRFFRVGGDKLETFPGLGLGLYISSEIIKRHNGKIWVESEKGQGSTFYLSLPINKRQLKQQKNTNVEEEIKHE
jgi:signal transduction histidine kinase